MKENFFNTTPSTHPHLYCGGHYCGGLYPMSPGQLISAETCAKALSVSAVGQGAILGELIMTTAKVLEKNGVCSVSFTLRKAQKIAIAALASEMIGVIESKGLDSVKVAFVSFLNDELEDFKSYSVGSIRSGGDLFAALFGAAGHYYYSEYSAVNGDTYYDIKMSQRSTATQLTSRVDSSKSGCSVRVKTQTTTVPDTAPSNTGCMIPLIALLSSILVLTSLAALVY